MSQDNLHIPTPVVYSSSSFAFQLHYSLSLNTEHFSYLNLKLCPVLTQIPLSEHLGFSTFYSSFYLCFIPSLPDYIETL